MTVADAKIPQELVINWDQTGVNVFPASWWTQEEKGSSRVEVDGVEDQHQITVTVAGTFCGKHLSLLMLYMGKTEWCHPSTAFPKGFDIYVAHSHWANSDTCTRFVKNIILLYISVTRKDLGLGEEHITLVIFDTFKGHKEDGMESLLLKNNVLSVLCPAIVQASSNIWICQ